MSSSYPILATGLLLAGLGCDADEPVSEPPPGGTAGNINLVFSNNLNGEIEPCG